MNTNRILFNFAIVAAFACGITACVNNPNTPVQPTGLSIGSHAIFIANQGTGSGDASLDCYEPDAGVYHSDIFKSVNKVQLGDFPNDLDAKGSDSLLILAENGNAVYMIDRHSARLLRTYTLPAGTTPFDLVLVNDSIAAITDFGSSGVLLLNTRTGAVDATLPTGPNPEGIALAGSNLVVCSPGYGDKREVDVLRSSPASSIQLQAGDNPVAVLGVADTLAIVLCSGFYKPATNSSVVFINPSTGTVSATLSLPASGAGAMALDGNLLYVPLDTMVLRIDVTQRAVRDTFATGVAAFAVTVDNVTHSVYLTVAPSADQGMFYAYDALGHRTANYAAGTFPGSLLVTH